MRRVSGHYNRDCSWAELITNGVIFINGANEHNCYIDSETKIGAGTKIGPGVILDEKTVIGKNCVIGGAGLPVIERSIIGDNVKIKHTCGVRDCEIGNDTNISEFVTVANLVGGMKKETKIGSRCMIGVHVTIIGGAQIGDECFIADNARVGGSLKLSSQTYFNPARAVSDKSWPPYINNGSWYLSGHYLALSRPVNQDVRVSFYVKAFHRCRQNGNIMKEWLSTPVPHLGRTPLECIVNDGENIMPCLLEECTCLESKIKNPG